MRDMAVFSCIRKSSGSKRKSAAEIWQKQGHLCMRKTIDTKNDEMKLVLCARPSTGLWPLKKRMSMRTLLNVRNFRDICR